MKMYKTILPLMCLCSLTACGTKVEKMDFLDGAYKTENHEYQTIKVKYIAEDIDDKLETQNTFTFKNGKYVAEDKNDYSDMLLAYAQKSITRADYFGDNFESYKDMDKANDKDAKIDSEIRYYLNPFKVIGVYSSGFKNKEYGISGSRKAEFKYEFNENGYLTFLKRSYSFDYTENKDGAFKSKKIEEYCKISISYKD